MIQVLGIDPGLASLGWGVVSSDGARLVYRAHGCISTASDSPLSARLASLRDGLVRLVSEYKPDQVAMEGLFFSRNVSSALMVAEVRGVIRLTFHDLGREVTEYLPNAVKQAAAGSASAGKVEVQNFVKMLLGLEKVPKPDHAADALAVAICHAFHTGAGYAALPVSG